MDPLELPAGFDPQNVPATVVMSGDGKRALCWHPLGDTHEAFTGTVDRLKRRNIVVLNAPPPTRRAA